jgi:hypothetical protein
MRGEERFGAPEKSLDLIMRFSAGKPLMDPPSNNPRRVSFLKS